MVQWRTPTEEETKYLLFKLQRENLFNKAMSIIGFICMLPLFFTPLSIIIELANGEENKIMILPCAVVCALSLFGACSILYGFITMQLSVRKYKNREIEITYGVLKVKREEPLSRGSLYIFEIELEDGTRHVDSVRYGRYAKIPSQSKMILVLMKSPSSMWKKYSEFYPSLVQDAE